MTVNKVQVQHWSKLVVPPVIFLLHMSLLTFCLAIVSFAVLWWMEESAFSVADYFEKTWTEFWDRY